jgi:hypothetical protein
MGAVPIPYAVELHFAFANLDPVLEVQECIERTRVRRMHSLSIMAPDLADRFSAYGITGR